jgi:hypothetical protein
MCFYGMVLSYALGDITDLRLSAKLQSIIVVESVVDKLISKSLLYGHRVPVEVSESQYLVLDE